MRTTESIIRLRASAVIDAVGRDEVGVYRMIKQLVATTIKEYRGRFLHELIQNGFDAHPPGTQGGKLAVHFHEDEGEFGVLYVANGGRALSESNFLRMASLGDSDKPIGVGIGNKGVGFKSVFQICDVPEVYSALDETDPGFSGFSFRFGTPDDLDSHIDRDDPLRIKLENELSLSLLTVPLDSIPVNVANLRIDGFVTVLRLPASSDRAAREIRDRLDLLLNSPSPIMMFLDRLETLSIQTSAETSPLVLTRRQEPDGELTRVVLNETDSYLLFEGVVPNSDLTAALEDAVDEGALDERWLSWDAEARVSVAVGDGWAVPNPSAFTFLPMGGSAKSPLGGHINAPFVTDFARLGLDVDQPVNRLMLRRIAEVCASGAKSLMAMNHDPGAVVDLAAWNPDSVTWITDAVEGLERVGLDDFIRLPTVGRGEWNPLARLSSWPDSPCQVITISRLVQSAGALLIDAIVVDSGRLDRLSRIGARESLRPSPDTVADWVERVAGSLATQETNLGLWRHFYDDLPHLFSTGEALYGKHIMLAQSGELVPADRPAAVTGARSKSPRQRAIFFAPKAAGTDDDDAVDSDVDISPPRSLSRRIVFLHGDLEWYDGPQQTPGRKFLQDHRLARQFRTASLLTHLSQLMAAGPSDAVKRDALDFAFRLFATSPSRHSKELASIGLAVPTRTGGWVNASTAHFSRGWDVLGAEDLSDLADGAPNRASELAGLESHLIVTPERLGSSAANVDKWTTFLKVLGVTATLPIKTAADPRRIWGQSLTPENIAGAGAPIDLPSAVVEQWAEVIKSAGNAYHPETHFSTNDPVCWFAGQHEIASLPARLRFAYARLVMLTLPTLEEIHTKSVWRRDRAGGWTSIVETPLWAFLTLADWVPVAVPGQPARAFCSPQEAWYIGVEDSMAAAYSPLVDSRLRRLMDSDDIGQRHWKPVGFLDWTAPRSAASLVDHLIDLFLSSDVPETASEHFRASLAAAWGSVGQNGTQAGPNLTAALLVDVQGQLVSASRGDAPSGRLFITGTRDQSATARLVRELGWPVVAVDASDLGTLREVARVLRSSWPSAVEVTADWQLEVLTDGTPWSPRDESKRLVEEVSWLPLLVAACMRHPRASGMRIGKQLDRVLDEVGRVRLVRAAKITVASTTGDQALPARLKGVLPMDGALPTLLTQHQESPPTWEQFEVLAQALLELLGQERFKAEISLTIRDLSTGPDQRVSRPNNSEFAAALQISNRQVAEVESAVFGAVGGVVARLRLVAPALWGEAALEPFNESVAAAYSRDDVLTVLIGLCRDGVYASEILNTATDTSDANDLRRRLDVPLADFNLALSTYFPTVPLVNNSPTQAEELDLRRRRRHRDLVNWARAARIDRFDSGEVQADWLEDRDLRFIDADPAWGTNLDDVGLELLDARIDHQMTARFGPNPTSGVSLPDFDNVQESNGRALRARIVEARRVVSAWCEREGGEVPPVWTLDSFDSELRMRLDRVGALDFRELSDDELATWLDRIDAWPRGMSLSVAADAHELSGEEVDAQKQADAAAKAEKARAAKRVQFQGTDVDLDTTMSVLVEQASRFLETQPASLGSAYRTSSLVEVVRRGGSGGGGLGSGASVRATSNRASNEQTSAIGLVGEMVAYHWLRNRDPSGLVDPSCWRSGNCRFVIEGAIGDDSLGFDFEVPRRGGTVMYEVKATTADAGMIELGETEVRCAQRFSRSDRWRLLIVENVMSSEPRVHMLPNPFRHDSRGQFSFVGNSVRLRFKLS